MMISMMTAMMTTMTKDDDEVNNRHQIPYYVYYYGIHYFQFGAPQQYCITPQPLITHITLTALISTSSSILHYASCHQMVDSPMDRQSGYHFSCLSFKRSVCKGNEVNTSGLIALMWVYKEPQPFVFNSFTLANFTTIPDTSAAITFISLRMSALPNRSSHFKDDKEFISH